MPVITFRTKQADQDTFQAIEVVNKRPGLEITPSDAVRIALAAWREAQAKHLAELIDGALDNWDFDQEDWENRQAAKKGLEYMRKECDGDMAIMFILSYASRYKDEWEALTWCAEYYGKENATA